MVTIRKGLDKIQIIKQGLRNDTSLNNTIINNNGTQLILINENDPDNNNIIINYNEVINPATENINELTDILRGQVLEFKNKIIRLEESEQLLGENENSLQNYEGSLYYRGQLLGEYINNNISGTFEQGIVYYGNPNSIDKVYNYNNVEPGVYNIIFEGYRIKNQPGFSNKIEIIKNGITYIYNIEYTLNNDVLYQKNDVENSYKIYRFNLYLDFSENGTLIINVYPNDEKYYYEKTYVIIKKILEIND